MIQQLQECIDDIAGVPDRFRVIILRSAVDKCFSAGADLKERAEMKEEEVAPFVDRLRSTFSSLENQVAVPTIAAIDGHALGGGFELALCCDIRYAGEQARVGLPETRLAILPAAGGSQRLPRLIGASRAKELIFTASILNATEACQYGIVNKSCPSAYSLAMEVANTISKHGPIAIREAKKSIDEGLRENDLYIYRRCR
jgi:methylglutaconyl-CoA hydratase